ncbi:MAG: DUF1993 domain-containing protein [Halieaceae bacterium]|jgi:hypothetical protein|nr:DUF1993 domain-containing protein [Halieaceae bacterium]
MSALMQQASARTFTHNLKNLSAILRKAEKDAKARGIEESVLMEARLAPDMLPFKAQVMIACDIAKGGCARLTANEMPVYPDDNASFAELQDRIKKTLAFIRGIKAAEYAGSDTREVEAQNPMGVLEFSGKDFLFGWALPNFYFHCATAYGILRHNGLQIGKGDWLGQVPGMTARGPIVKAFGLKTKKKPGKKTKRAAGKPAAKTAAKAAGKKPPTKKPARKKATAKR